MCPTAVGHTPVNPMTLCIHPSLTTIAREQGTTAALRELEISLGRGWTCLPRFTDRFVVDVTDPNRRTTTVDWDDLAPYATHRAAERIKHAWSPGPTTGTAPSPP